MVTVWKIELSDLSLKQSLPYACKCHNKFVVFFMSDLCHQGLASIMQQNQYIHKVKDQAIYQVRFLNGLHHSSHRYYMQGFGVLD
ncbi:hypothetical protein COLO4_37715 [Corchorus olitorius]|uniref:Uncharacterized protein n=1 Tax=Corchorus olitorius TaxID=93759 RepID=A0A1R3FZT4_9ROSI|nr:hypothetical protein COLO4_37715 [Corchorus olitorius]